MATIGIIGSRRRDTLKDFLALLDVFNDVYVDGDILISGGCRKGGDRFAEIISNNFNIPIKIHYPDKSKLPVHPERYHFAQINYARNSLIAEDSDILIAVVANDRKGGTEDTIKKYFKLGKDNIYIVEEN